MGFAQVAMPAAIAGILAVAALFLTWRRLAPMAAPRRTLLVAVRAAAIGCLLLMLADPTLTRSRSVHAPPRVAVLLDRSASMSLKDAPGGKARLAWGIDLLRSGAPLNAVLAGAEVFAFLFADHVSPAPAPIAATASGQATDVGAALATAIVSSAGDGPDAVILVSDGASNRGLAHERLSAWAGRQRVPVYCLGVGSQRRQPDAWLVAVDAPRRIRAGSSATITTTLGSRGLEGKVVKLSLSGEGVASAQREVVLAPAGRRRVQFSVRPGKPGLYRCTVGFESLPGEWTAANNSRSFSLQVEPGTAKLLLVAGRPGQELKFIRRVLDGARDLQVTYLVRKSGQGFWEEGDRPVAGRRLPADRALNEHAAVMLCDVPASAFGAGDLQRLAEFVRVRGGGLGMLGGEESFGAGGYAGSPLAAALGVRMAGGAGYSAVPAKVRTASQSAVTAPVSDIERNEDFPGWGALPLVAGHNQVDGVRAGATSLLAGANGRPLLVVQRYGLGRTLCWMAAGTFRWVLSRDATEASRKGHAVFWIGIANWLTTPPNRSPVALETDRDIYESGDAARLIVNVTDEGFRPESGAKVVVEVSRAGGQVTRVTLAEVAGAAGRYESGLPVDVPGTYRLKARASAGGEELGSDERQIVAEAPRRELADPAQNVALLKAIAGSSGGAYVAAEDVAGLAQAFRLPPATQTVWTRDRWARSLPGLLGFLALVGLDWFLRRWWGVG